MNKESILDDLNIQRGQTQKGVNRKVLSNLIDIMPSDSNTKILDLPCGNMELLGYMHQLTPNAKLYGADITKKDSPPFISFRQMDLTKEFVQLPEQDFDIITSISGVMMFGNTLGFIRNCVSKLKTGGTFVLTNDNVATIMDRFAYLLLARYRIFMPIYHDNELLTDIIPIQELCYILRKNGIEIDNIEYTSSYLKDLIYLPIAVLIYPLQWLYLQKFKNALPEKLLKSMYPFKHLFCKHYIITGHKSS